LNRAVPSCPACGLYYTPTSLRTDGTCPHCMQTIDWKRAKRSAESAVAADTDDLALPWHFKLLLAAAVLYLGFRGWQGVEWVIDRF
jgi:hypothetical protein